MLASGPCPFPKESKQRETFHDPLSDVIQVLLFFFFLVCLIYFNYKRKTSIFLVSLIVPAVSVGSCIVTGKVGSQQYYSVFLSQGLVSQGKVLG